MKLFGSTLIVVFAAMSFFLWGQYNGQTGNGIEIVKRAEAAGGKVTDPDGTAPDRYVYYPGTEELGKDEIRLVALGTGMPLARRSQAAQIPGGHLLAGRGGQRGQVPVRYRYRGKCESVFSDDPL
jgi:hypothetical protein